MSVSSIPLYRADGRIRGTFVYMLLCRDDGPVYIKIGITDSPHNRLQQLRGGCPVTPRQFCTMEVHGRAYAKEVELALHVAADRWSAHGEWFCVPMDDKAAFNAAWKQVLAKKEKPGWPGRWDQIAVAPYVEAGERKRQLYRATFVRKGRAFSDFQKDLRSSGESCI